MYLDFEDYRPDIQPIGRAISWREGILLSIIVHLMMVIVILLAPRFFPPDPNARARALMVPARQEPPTRFVFVQPRMDRPAPRPPDRGEASDVDRLRRSPEPGPNLNPLPKARGNSPERTETPPDVARGRGPEADPSQGKPQERQADADGSAASPTRLPESQSALSLPPDVGVNGRSRPSGDGVLRDAIRNLPKFEPRGMFDNQQGGGQTMGPLQFDTKGVEFGPWIRRFIALVRRNWILPNSAMFAKGHVVITFNVHKDGSLTDITVVSPCPIEAFNTAAYGALKSSNPAVPLPPEYPSESAFITATFFYNEDPYR